MSTPYRTQGEVEPQDDSSLITFPIDLPSRAQLQFRAIGAKEMSAIGKSNTTAQERLFMLLTSCHVKTTDPGPYKEVEIGSLTTAPNWNRIPWGDVFYAVVGLYKGSFRRKFGEDDQVVEIDGVDTSDLRRGDLINFDFTCQYCRKLRPWQVLTDDVLANNTPISDEVYETILEGKPLVAKLHGKEVFWLPPTHQRDVPFIKELERRGQVEETAVELLAKHLVRVPALGDRKQTPHDLWFWAQASLSMDDVDELLEQIDRDNWGLNSLIALECDKCRTEQAQALPFGQIFASRRTTHSKLLARAKMR